MPKPSIACSSCKRQYDIPGFLKLEHFECPCGQRITELTAGDYHRYQLGELMASGGMGDIAVVHDRTLKRPLALKRLKTEHRHQLQRLTRFIREAQITAALSHPNIVPVHDLFVHQGELIFTMKKVEGLALDSVIDKLKAGHDEYQQQYPLHKRLQVFTQIGQALSFAHSKGIVHRDLKPANVMLGNFGEVFVMDWGLAKNRQDTDFTPVSALTDGPQEPQDIFKTQLGQVLGTPMYMSPEQAAGRVDDIDERSDIFSLGALLLTLVTLRRPYAMDQEKPLRLRVQANEYLAPGAHPDDGPVPVELRAIIAKAMKLKKDQRYQSVRQFTSDVDAYLSGFSVSVHQDNLLTNIKKWVQRHPTISAALATGLLALIVAIIATSSLQQASLRQSADLLIRSAMSHLEKNDPDLARQQFTQALGLFPNDSQINEGLQQAILAQENSKRRRQAEALQRQLNSDLKKAKRIGQPQGSAGKAQWYENYTAAFDKARQILDFQPDSEQNKKQFVDLALKLSQQYRRDKSFDMAELMVSQAESRGWPAHMATALRADIQQARLEGSSKQVEAVLAILNKADSMLEMDEEQYQDLLNKILMLKSSKVVQTLIEEFNHNFLAAEYRRYARWSRNFSFRLIADALSIIGDRQTRGAYRESWHKADHWLQSSREERCVSMLPMLSESYHRLSRSAMIKDQVFATSEQALELKLMYWVEVHALHDSYDFFKEQNFVTCARALESFKAGQGSVPLALARWYSGYRSNIWHRTTEIHKRLGLSQTHSPPLQRGYELMSLERFQEASLIFESQCQVPDARLQAVFGRAVTSVMLGRRGPKVLEDFARTECLEDINWPYFAALAHIQAGQWKEAQAILSYKTFFNYYGNRYMLLADELEKRGQHDEALKYINRAVRENGHVEAYSRRARLRLAKGDTLGAIMDLNELLSSRPESLKDLALRAKLLKNHGGLGQAARDLLRAKRLEPENFKWIQQHAQCQFEIKDRGYEYQNLEYATLEAKRAYLADPENPEAVYLYAQAQYQRIQRFVIARAWTPISADFLSIIELLTPVYRRVPRRPYLDLLLLCNQAVGHQRQQLSDLELAFEQGLVDDSKSSPAVDAKYLKKYLEICSQLNLPKRAWRTFETLAKNNPKDKELARTMAQFLYSRTQNKVPSELERALALMQGAARQPFLLYAAEYYRRRKQWRDSQAQLKQALTIDPSSPHALLEQAIWHFRQRQIEPADGLLKRVEGLVKRDWFLANRAVNLRTQINRALYARQSK